MNNSKKLVILVIASMDNGPYKFLINEVWSNLIKQVSRNRFIDIYLLFDRDTDLKKIDVEYLRDNIIINNNTDHNGQHICVGVEDGDKWNGGYIPGLLSKTIYAFSHLVNKYDIFYRTNLTSIPHLENLWSFVNNNDISYSGFYVWDNTLRQQIMDYHLIANNRCLTDMNNLDKYKGNSFVSGSGFFLNRGEVIHILENRKNIRYDIVDDVSIGLLIDKCLYINNIASNYIRLSFDGREFTEDFSKINFNHIINKIEKVKDPFKIVDIRITLFSSDDNSMKIIREIWNIIRERYPKSMNYGPGFRRPDSKRQSKLNKFEYI